MKAGKVVEDWGLFFSKDEDRHKGGCSHGNISLDGSACMWAFVYEDGLSLETERRQRWAKAAMLCGDTGSLETAENLLTSSIVYSHSLQLFLFNMYRPWTLNTKIIL